MLSGSLINDSKFLKFDTLDETLDFFLLAKQRKIFICSQFDDTLARDVIKKIWFLSSLSKDPITVIINSGGGSVTAGLAIWDQLRSCGSEIITIVTGLAASMGAMLMLVGDKGKRYATKNSRIMIHQPSMGGFEGQTTDLMIQADEIIEHRRQLVGIMSERTGISVDKLEEMIDRDAWMSVEEAKAKGFIDAVIEESEVPVC